ncbi:MAG: hypothetical protein FWD48_00905 [Oscillospiraceae bacterium]|nr:hypothetical protein [Oscillospiraceae bacterium]
MKNKNFADSRQIKTNANAPERHINGRLRPFSRRLSLYRRLLILHTPIPDINNTIYYSAG